MLYNRQVLRTTRAAVYKNVNWNDSIRLVQVGRVMDGQNWVVGNQLNDPSKVDQCQ